MLSKNNTSSKTEKSNSKSRSDFLNKFITREELKKRYGIGNDKVSILINLPKFPTLKIGCRYLIDLEKLIRIENEAIEKNKRLEELLVSWACLYAK